MSIYCVVQLYWVMCKKGRGDFVVRNSVRFQYSVEFINPPNINPKNQIHNIQNLTYSLFEEHISEVVELPRNGTTIEGQIFYTLPA